MGSDIFSISVILPDKQQRAVMNPVTSHQGKDLGNKYIKKRDVQVLGQIMHVERNMEESCYIKTCFG